MFTMASKLDRRMTFRRPQIRLRAARLACWLGWAIFGLLTILSATIAQAAEIDVPPHDRARMEAIILEQLDAFKRDDGVSAFGYASPGIQKMFGTPERFMQMVRQGYPQVYRARDVEVRDLVDFRGQPAMIVHIVGQDGLAVLALYPMELQPNGVWRIDGCYLLKSPDVGA